MEQYARDGHVIIDNALSASLVAELNAIVDARLANEKDPDEDYKAGFKKYRFRGGGLQPGVSDAPAGGEGSSGEREYSNERRLRHDPPPGWEQVVQPDGSPSCPAFRALIEPPAIAPVLAELLSEPPFRTDPDTHPFRCEDSFTTMRRGGFEPVGTTMPHGVRPPQLASGVSYRAEGGQIFGGLIRVCWELAPVERGEGGT